MATDPHIGTLNEGSLHAALKAAYRREGDRCECRVAGYVCDIARDDLLIEIQTSSLASLGPKLDRLLCEHRVLVVHPIAIRTRLDRPTGTRWSPKRGSIHHLFDELVSVPTLLDHPNLALDVALVEVRKVQQPDARARRGRGGHRTVDRVLERVVAIESFRQTVDLMRLLPAGLPDPFTTADLAAAITTDRRCAQRMAYCLRAAGLLVAGRRTAAGIEHHRAT